MTPVPARATDATRPWRAVARMAPLLALAALVPVFWFPYRSPLATLLALLVIPVYWLLRWWLGGRPWLPSGVALLLLLVLLAAMVATIPITDWQLGLPKLLGLLLGVAALLAIGDAVSSRRALGWAIWALLGLAALLLLVGLVATEWSSIKQGLPRVPQIRPPLLIRGVLPNTSEGGINPNELAGALVLLLPVLLSQPAAVVGLARPSGTALLRAAGAGLLGVAALTLLALTQSRSGLVGAAVGLGLLGVLCVAHVVSPRRRVVSALAVLALGAILVVVGGWLAWPYLVAWLAAPGVDLESGLSGRLQLWSIALYMLQDFPLTGIGLGQFSPVFHKLYFPPNFLPGQYVPHAHNLYLEYALELGIPGALLFALLVVVFFRRCARAAGSPDPLVRWTGIGLALGVIAFLSYGLADAIAPGARAGLLLWIVLGVGLATGRLAECAQPRPSSPGR